MPYTPPGQQSPASTKSNSPALSRSSSYSEHSDNGPRSPAIGRPTPPRSMSSSSYLRKHRRSPSITKPDNVHVISQDDHVHTTDFALSGSLRQSPPPVNNLSMPTGAVLSPPESPKEGSDGDDDSKSSRRRAKDIRLEEELRLAAQGISQRREGSPDRVGVALTDQPASEPVSQATSPTALTASARKISHSRSSTETSIIIPRTQFESPTQTSSESEDEDGPLSKPALVRKKSGELVKPALRPSSRRRYSSMPGTPTYSKSVHFNDNGNQTRHFLQVDKPLAVSAGSSPVETYDSEGEFPFDAEAKAEREIKLSNFPADTFERRTKPIRVDRLFLSTDKQTLIGVCAVQNIAFHKLVVARFTLDHWKTTSEVVAEYNNDTRQQNIDGCDRFNFHIKLSDQANIDDKTLLLCVRYNVGGQEFWDNNDNTNYRVDFSKVVPTVSKPVVPRSLGSRPLNGLPRSRHSPSATVRGRQESIDDDFAAHLDSSSMYSFSQPDHLLGESPTSIKLKPRGKRGSIFPTGAAAQSSHGLGGRYDFGASLSAALSSAQDKLGRQSGLMNGAPKSSSGSYFGPVERTEGPVKSNERPDELTTERPAIGSDQYKDLVQKFCYFTPTTGKASQSTIRKPTNHHDGVNENEDGDDTSTPSSGSGTTSPTKRDSVHDRKSPVLSPFTSRLSSPAPLRGGVLGGRAASPISGRATSPISFGYPYNIRDENYLSASPTPTAIQG